MVTEIHTYIAVCCREWIAPIGYRGGRCGRCGCRPKYLRPDPLSPVKIRPPIREQSDISTSPGNFFQKTQFPICM